MIYLIFNGSILQLISGRGAIYYNIAEMIVIPVILIKFFKKRIVSILVWTVYFCLLLFVMNRDMDYYKEGDYDIFRPYKTVFTK